MIEKWYCLKCDTCGGVVNYWCESSAKDAIERERNNGAGAVVLQDGKCFCCADCHEIWINTRKYKRREAREINKIIKRFGGEDE